MKDFENNYGLYGSCVVVLEIFSRLCSLPLEA